MTLDLREHFSEFRGADPARIHLAAHSHHFWPDAACRGHRRALEDAARPKHVSRISLETGIRQPEAIGLYRASGYQDCPPFGTYTPDPLSLFMTKRLQP